jgi:acylphosphatase
VLRRRIVIRGRVQGVSFRFYASREARRNGVAGWIRNRADGSVEAVAEGEPDAVAAFVEWCHEGPPAARVEHVELLAEEPEGLGSFEIRG